MEIKEVGLEQYLSESLRKHYSAIPLDYKLKTEREMKLLFKPDEKLELLRDSFWAEYSLALTQGRTIQGGNIWRGVCHKWTWHAITKDIKKLAYITTPIVEYEKELKTILRDKAPHTFKKILDADINQPIMGMNSETGEQEVVGYKVDSGLARTQLTAIKDIADRIMGMSVQRSEIKAVSVNITEQPASLEELDRKIAELDRKIAGELDHVQEKIVEAELVEEKE